jgi:hypothetical protein
MKLKNWNISKCNKTNLIFSHISKLAGLRLTTKSIHQSTRDDNKNVQCISLRFKPPSNENEQAYVPLLNVSVEAWIDSFAADVTLTQVFVNREENPIEAIYVFPIEVCHLKKKDVIVIRKCSNIENDYKKFLFIGKCCCLFIYSSNRWSNNYSCIKRKENSRKRVRISCTTRSNSSLNATK